MSNSPLITYTRLSPNHSGQRTHAIDRITPHCIVGQCTVETLGNIFAPVSIQSSSNYGVGYDGRIGMYCEEKNRSWCTSSNANDQRAVTIEVASGTKEPYEITDAAYEGLINLMTDICKRNGKAKLLWFGDKDKTLNYSPKSDEMVITVHRWFANKSCPGTYIYERLGKMATEVTKRLGGKVTKPDSKPNSGSGAKSNTSFPAAPFRVEVIVPDLNYRSEPSMGGNVKGQTGKGVFTITKVKNGWGKLKSGSGWIYLENPAYCKIGETVKESKPVTPKKSVDEIAKEVIQGKWGNGLERKNRLSEAGYDYDAVQKRVSELL